MTRGSVYRWRRLTPDQERAIRVAHPGVSLRVLANRYGVSKRTIERTLQRDDRGDRTVRVGGYEAPFTVRDEGPRQVGPWLPARPPVIVGRVVLGPCPCQGCGKPVNWTGWSWVNSQGGAHRCSSVKAA